ncbi:MAG: PKD domain-containing protein [Acidobacteriota bacterium]
MLLCVVAAAALASCRRVPLTAPSGAGITLIGASTVAANGQIEITAVVIEGSAPSSSTSAATTSTGGTPVHDGTVVTFTTTLGRIEPVDAETKNGKATVKLVTDGKSGVASITAFSGSAKSEALDINVGAAAATQLALTASPQTLPGTGGSSTISARVEDKDGNGLSAIPVSFSTTKGNLSATSGVTNDQGVAVTTLTTTEAADVTALTGGGTAGLSGKVSVTLKPRTTVSISTAAASAVVAVPVTFTITPGTNAIITNAVVDFGDGGSAQMGTITAATPISHAFRSQGTKTVKATVTDSDGGTGSSSTQIAVSPLAVSITVSGSTPGVPITLTATTSAGALIDKYEWDFGDTTFAVTTDKATVHTFNTGRYVISLKVTPSDSGSPVQTVTFIDVKVGI